MELLLSTAVREAKREGRPLVALESSVLAQGLPWPHNLEAAKRCEAAIAAEGAVPATVAVVRGAICVGLEVTDLERLATGQGTSRSPWPRARPAAPR